MRPSSAHSASSGQADKQIARQNIHSGGIRLEFASTFQFEFSMPPQPPNVNIYITHFASAIWMGRELSASHKRTEAVIYI